MIFLEVFEIVGIEAACAGMTGTSAATNATIIVIMTLLHTAFHSLEKNSFIAALSFRVVH